MPTDQNGAMGTRIADVGGLVADCRIRAATDLLSHRWDGVVLAVLGSGPHRRVELRSAIGQVADRPLTEALARLMAAQLVSRHPQAHDSTVPVYELTPLGRTFHDGPLRSLAAWAEDHADGLLGDDPCSERPA